MKRHSQRTVGLAGIALLGAALFVLLLVARAGDDPRQDGDAVFGEARRGGLTVPLQAIIDDIEVTEARAPGRPIVLIDPGHGGADGGAPGVSGQFKEKDLTLAFSRELRDLLAERGLVRVALTRNQDRALSLDQRAVIARTLGASLLVSVHMDSAPNAVARGATVYSLSDVASDAEAARFAQAKCAASR